MAEPSSNAFRASAVYDAFASRRGHTLRWENITVIKGGKVIDDNMSGTSEAGHLTAVMGHSGSGKVR